jgi:hypothetical protein
MAYCAMSEVELVAQVRFIGKLEGTIDRLCAIAAASRQPGCGVVVRRIGRMSFFQH